MNQTRRSQKNNLVQYTKKNIVNNYGYIKTNQNYIYDAQKYIKSDLKWSSLTAVIIFALMIILYFVFR
jgi:hypothetical protein